MTTKRKYSGMEIKAVILPKEIDSARTYTSAITKMKINKVKGD